MNQGMQHYFIQMQLSGLATTASHYSSGVSKYICTAKKIKIKMHVYRKEQGMSEEDLMK